MTKKDIIKRKKGEIIHDAKIDGEQNNKVLAKFLEVFILLMILIILIILIF